VEEREIEMTLHIPGADFIGFEHSALSEKQREELERKIEQVETAENLVTFKTGWFNKVRVLEQEVHKGHHDGEAHEGEHRHHEDEAHEGEHKDQHEEHSEYELHLHFEADKASAVRRADFDGLFELFPSLREIDWILIDESGQKAGVITAASSRIDF
jgi:ABC-type Zn2+ transport system substrate-binding protein/surface adhesin